MGENPLTVNLIWSSRSVLYNKGLIYISACKFYVLTLFNQVYITISKPYTCPLSARFTIHHYYYNSNMEVVIAQLGSSINRPLLVTTQKQEYALILADYIIV